MLKTNYKLQVGTKPVALHQFIEQQTGIATARVVDIIQMGAVWLISNKRARTRLKDQDLVLSPGQDINVYYDESLYSIRPPLAECFEDQKQYSIWFKPSRLLTQGNLYGDYCSLQNQIERDLPSRRVYLVHRLDYEVSGLILFAHSKKMAAAFSKMLQEGKITKTYRAQILGKLAQDQGSIELPLDGKYALSDYSLIHFNSENNTSIVDVKIRTGRFHQIRRHFDLMGHPIIGDPKYGKNNKNSEGLKLQAIGLAFICPINYQKKSVNLDDQKIHVK